MKEIIFADLLGLGIFFFTRYVLQIRPSFRDAVLIALGGASLFVFAMFYQSPEVVFDSSKGDFLDKKLVLTSMVVTSYGLVAAILGFPRRAKVKQ